MQPVSPRISTPLIGNPEIRDVANRIRRQLPGELETIQHYLTESSLHDETSELIRNWYQVFQGEFTATINLERQQGIPADLEGMLNRYLEMLADILIDQNSNQPYDEQTLLGSDGEAYGYRWYCIYLHHVDPAYRNRSPLSPEINTRFTVSPHVLIGQMVVWIRRFMPDFRSQLLEDQFNALPVIPAFPEPETARSRARDIVARRRAEQAGIPLGSLDERMRAIAERNHVQFVQQPQNARADEIVTQIRQEIFGRVQQLDSVDVQFAQMANERLNGIEQREADQIQNIQNEIAQLDVEIEHLETDITEIDDQLNRTDVSLDQAKRARLELERSRKQLELEIARAKKKKKQKLIKAIVTTVVIVVVCIYAPELGLSSAKGGGLNFKFTLPW